MNSRATCLMGESHHQEALQEAERVLETKEGENFHVDAMFVKAEALFLQCKVLYITYQVCNLLQPFIWPTNPWHFRPMNLARLVASHQFDKFSNSRIRIRLRSFIMPVS